MSFDLSLTDRRNYVAEFTICESDEPLVGVTARAYRRQAETETFAIYRTTPSGSEGTLTWAHFVIVRDTNGNLYEPPNRSYTAVAGGPKATLRLLLNSVVGYQGYAPYSRIALVELARETGLSASASGDKIRVVFPTGGEWDEDGQWGYEVRAGGGVIASGIATVARVPGGDDDDDDDSDDSDSTFEVCNFSAAPAA